MTFLMHLVEYTTLQRLSELIVHTMIFLAMREIKGNGNLVYANKPVVMNFCH